MISRTHSNPSYEVDQLSPAQPVWLSTTISVPAATGIYTLFMLLAYWPVLVGSRFFWEDFFTQEYPIREFCYYMAGITHTLPFWNPYSWGRAPLLADPQNGFWYPANLLQIVLVRLFAPSSIHLPIVIPEITTLLHLPLAALGLFYLLKKEFHVSDMVALIAGLAWGFGARMAAEQNHAVLIIPLALLPWETLLAMRSWSSWKYAVGLGLLLGISFFGSQPQSFLFITLFLVAFTASEVIRHLRSRMRWKRAIAPLLYLSLALIVTIGISAIQLLPSEALSRLTARQSIPYEEASSGSTPLGLFGTLFVPKFFGENPGFAMPLTPLNHAAWWWWEGALYWGVLAEILSLFAVVRFWKHRSEDSRARHLLFFVCFALFAVVFAMGKYSHLQELFWRYVPLFEHFRAPNRMMWFFLFIGALLTGIGLDAAVKERGTLKHFTRFFAIVCGIFLVLNILSMLGWVDLLLNKARPGLWHLIFHSFLASVLAALFFYSVITHNRAARWMLPLAAIIIAADLYFVDITWHRNTVDLGGLVRQDSTNATVRKFRITYQDDHAKLAWLLPDSLRKVKSQLGMFLRLPIEYILEPREMRNQNPLLLNNFVPPARNDLQKMEIIGITTVIDTDLSEHVLTHALPFLKLYPLWSIATSDSDAQRQLHDTAFHIDRMIYLNEDPKLPKDFERSQQILATPDTVNLTVFSENHLSIIVRTSRPAVLLVNDQFYPAWHATVDGKETKILRAFTSLRAVPVNSGIHTVEMQYDDPAFDLGWKITLGTLAVSLCALFIGKKQKNPET
jgi:hypothetical protein